MDMRFFWLKDRVSRNQFEVEYCPGRRNVADHLTKDLPTHLLKSLATFVIWNNGRARSVNELPINVVRGKQNRIMFTSGRSVDTGETENTSPQDTSITQN